jgi:hypothetical protein
MRVVSASLRALILELLVLILDDTPLTVGPAAEHHVLKQLVLHAFLYEQRCVFGNNTDLHCSFGSFGNHFILFFHFFPT